MTCQLSWGTEGFGTPPSFFVWDPGFWLCESFHFTQIQQGHGYLGKSTFLCVNMEFNRGSLVAGTCLPRFQDPAVRFHVCVWTCLWRFHVFILPQNEGVSESRGFHGFCCVNPSNRWFPPKFSRPKPWLPGLGPRCRCGLCPLAHRPAAGGGAGRARWSGGAGAGRAGRVICKPRMRMVCVTGVCVCLREYFEGTLFGVVSKGHKRETMTCHDEEQVTDEQCPKPHWPFWQVVLL